MLLSALTGGKIKTAKVEVQSVVGETCQIATFSNDITAMTAPIPGSYISARSDSASGTYAETAQLRENKGADSGYCQFLLTPRLIISLIPW